ncbi:MAG TPA: tail fiber domain-containing protein [Thermoanaerobaculia bacterium]
MRARSSILPLLALGLSVTLSLPLSADSEKKQEPVGKTSVGATGVDWAVNVDHDILVLTVVDPKGDVVATKEFNSGKNPTFRLNDLPGKQVQDGTYTYELRVVPRISGNVKKQLAEARANEDDAAVKRIQRENGLDSTVVQAGAFTISGGAFIPNNLTEAGANDAATTSPRRIGTEQNTPSDEIESAGTLGTQPRFRIGVNDQVIPDNLIVQGSTCTGFDCVNGESFGFDTLRLKENNLRINFDDTSASAGYPSNDWRIVANDSASGGANKFVIEDSTAARNPMTIEAAAPANSIYVAASGNVGFQQSAPGLDLHLTTSDTPALRLEQNNSGGFTAQTWDIGGNEANFFIRDLTGGSKLSFRIRPGAPTSSIDIAGNGNVGVGTASPSQKLDVRGSSATADTFAFIGSDPTNGPGMLIGHAGGTSGVGRGGVVINSIADASAVAPNPSVRILIAGAQRFIIDNQGYMGIGGITDPSVPVHSSTGASLSVGGVWTNASSRDYKQHIQELSTEEAMATVAALKPVTYEYKVDPNDPQVGFIAEDVPSLVATPDRKGLATMDVVAVLTKVVQEQQKTIEQLNERLSQLETKQQ